jgi:hypothetical protein
MILHPSFLHSMCAALLALSVACGEAVAAEVSNAGGPVFTVLAAGARPLPEKLHYLATVDEGILLKTSFARRSEPVPARAGRTLVFGIPRENPAEGESRFVVLGSVICPAGISERGLVLLSTDGNRLSGMVIDDGEKTFPAGTLRVVNLLNRPLAARWDETTWEVSPGPGVARPYPSRVVGGAGQASRFRVMLGALREDGKGSTLIYSGRAEARPGARTLVVVREVKETDLTDEGEVVNAGVSYNVRWVVDAPVQITE